MKFIIKQAMANGNTIMTVSNLFHILTNDNYIDL